ncbi:envelope protein US28 [Cercopithecine betaherpesvirus 5]|uniref:Envelope protein US28 n=1 Tax=Simian cytomegalovirus (strain Colburn) TaxID=50292 RepID=G8XTN6_SCMVC|nr:envelope protein US28 [Cercopithecine betaherpesvirus 5]AEV80528.1 envelope protein US28 [Cercopithecine betaherpesvirus 5]
MTTTMNSTVTSTAKATTAKTTAATTTIRTTGNTTITTSIKTSSTSANITSTSTVSSTLASTLTTVKNNTTNVTLTTLTSPNTTSTLISTIASNSTLAPNITSISTAITNTTTTSLTSLTTALTTTLLETTTFDYDDDAEACNLTDIVHTTRPVTVTFYTIIFILGLLGNFLVLMTIVWNRRISFASDIYFMNLAISDLMFVCTLPFWIMYLLNHDVMSHVSCVVMTAIFYCALFASTVFLLLIILDRCYAILWGIERADYRLLRNSTWGCILMWALCIVLALPHFIFLKKGDNVCVAEYHDLTNFYVVFINTEVNMCTLILPAAAIIYWYLRLSRLTKTHQRYRKRLTSLNIVLAVAIVFAIFWLPYNLLLMVYSLVHMQIPWGCESDKILRRGLILTESIALCHCCINPFIYVVFGQRCRSEFCHLLRALLSRVWPTRSWGFLRSETVSLSLSQAQGSSGSSEDDFTPHDELQFLI